MVESTPTKKNKEPRCMTRAAQPADSTSLLRRWSNGDAAAFDLLARRLYEDIHAIAVRELRPERQLTLRPTDLAHEAYLRLTPLRKMHWQDRSHFLSMAVRVMRQALIDEARRRRAQKRDGVILSDTQLGGSDAGVDALDVDALLIELHCFDAVASEVASLRVFGGLSLEETAEAIGLSFETVNRHWVKGKAWLARELLRTG
jgi:RNA polymerase sigma factor (TIGR02999 family)